jgi:hypothetical protein
MAKVYIPGAVKKVRILYGDQLKKVTKKNKIHTWLSETVEILWDGYKTADPNVAVEISNFHPTLIGASNEAIFSENITYGDIESIILEEYGFLSWDEAKEAGNFDPVFEHAVNTALSGDVASMQQLLNKHPTLINQSSDFGHGANLIQYLAANGIEIWRQYISIDVINMLELLIENGADPDFTNNIYGGSNLRSLIETCDHTFQSGKADQMLERLEVYGY